MGAKRVAMGKFVIGATLAMALLVLAFGLTAVSPPAEAQDNTIKLVFPTPPVPVYLPYFAAKDLGWLEKAGIRIEELWLLGDAAAIKAVLAGSGDVALTSPWATLPAIAEGAKIKAFASWQATPDYVVIALKSKIKSYKDLQGATIAVAGPRGDVVTEIFNQLMKKHGVDPSSAKFVVIGGHEARMKAVAAQKADATLVGELYAAKAKEFPEIHALGRIPEEFPNIGYAYLIATEDTLQKKASLIEKFVRHAVIEGSRHVVQNPERGVEYLRKRIPDLDVNITKEVVQKLAALRLFGVNGGLEPAVTEYTLKLATDIGLLTRPLRIEDVLDRRFVTKVTGELGAFR